MPFRVRVGGALVVLRGGVQNLVDHFLLLGARVLLALRNELRIRRRHLVGGMEVVEVLNLGVVAGPVVHRDPAHGGGGEVFRGCDGRVVTIPCGLVEPGGGGRMVAHRGVRWAIFSICVLGHLSIL